jgi:hypothetical protein
MEGGSHLGSTFELKVQFKEARIDEKENELTSTGWTGLY